MKVKIFYILLFLASLVAGFGITVVTTVSKLGGYELMSFLTGITLFTILAFSKDKYRQLIKYFLAANLGFFCGILLLITALSNQ